MRDSNTITGTVIGVCNCGTLVVVYLEDDGRVVPIPVEHRAFQWLLDGEQCSTSDLMRRRVSYDGDNLRFLD